jgi:xanthine dehydrogenase accessory factor
MENVDVEVLKSCALWLAEGRQCELITVVKTWGSSPRPPGAMLAIADNGQVIGSVSGGCVEDDLIARVRENGMRSSKPEMITYGGSGIEAERFGIPCGGTLQLVKETLTYQSQIQALLNCLNDISGKNHTNASLLIQRVLHLDSGVVELSPANHDASPQLTDTTLTTIHGPRWRCLIIGAGQLSRFLAPIALGMGYQITVCDPREEYSSTWDIEGVKVVSDMPDDVVMAMQLDCRCAVLALTHDPKLDDMALMEALKTDAFYIGAIGSRNNNARRRERLTLLDLTEEQITKLHGPIGLYIGSKTPPEIAISILAQMTAIKNKIEI